MKMNRGYFTSKLVLQLNIIFILISVLPIIIFIALNYTSTQMILKENTESLLDVLIESKSDKIEYFADEKIREVNTLANLPDIAEKLTSLDTFFKQNAIHSKEYKKTVDGISPFLAQLCKRLDFYDIFIINNKGDILLTVKKEDDLFANLKTGPLKKSPLAKVFEKATSALITEVSDFAYYSPSNKEAAFVASPIIHNRKIIGAVAAQIDFDKLYEILTDITSLGESGEIIAGSFVDSDIIYTSPLRHKEDMLFKSSSHDPIGKAILYDAIKGKKGFGGYVDYRGKEVFAGWRYVPSLRWGIIAKIDKNEAFKPLYEKIKFIIMIISFVLFLVFLAIRFGINRVSNPILHLNSVVKSFFKGDYSTRVEIDSDNEIGILGDNFNKMAKSFQNSLKSIKESETRFRTILENSNDGINIIDTRTKKIIFTNRKFCEMIGYTEDELIELDPKNLHPKDSDYIRNRNIERLVSEDVREIEIVRMLRKDGSIFLANMTVSKPININEKLVMIVFIRDVTRQLELNSKIIELNKNLEKAVQEKTKELSETNYELNSILNFTPMVVYIKNLDGKYLRANKAFAALTDFTEDEIVGKDDIECFGEENAAGFRKNDLEVIKNSKATSIEERIKKGADLFIYISTKFPLFDAEGRPYAICGISMDITERKRYEKALQKERDFSNAVIDGAESMIVILDDSAKIIRANSYFERKTGYEESELKGNLLWDMYAKEDDINREKECCNHLESGEAIGNSETSIVTKDGKLLVVEWSTSVLRDENEKISNIVRVGSDITEKRELLDMLERSSNSLNKAQEIGHVGSWEWDIIDGGLSWSDEIYRIFGLTPQEFEATYEAFLKYIHPDDREKVTAAVNDSLQNETDYFVEHRVVQPDGKLRVVQESGQVIMAQDGTPEKMIGVVHDITELKRTQTELENVNEELSKYIDIIDHNVVTSTTDENEIITQVSDAFCEITGYSREELVGQKHHIIRHPDTAENLIQHLKETIHSGKDWSGELKNMKKNGSAYWIDIVITPNFDKNGNIIGFTSISNDITDKKIIEEISITDALTGLYNRRYFNQILSQEYNRAKRDKNYLAFIMMDIDHFKQYNDTYGHQMGDDVLRSIGKTLKESVKRASDYVFRIGGEEFCFILAGVNKDHALDFAYEVRKRIEELKIEHSKNSTGKYVTISMGVHIKEPKSTESIESIMKKADEALYEAKEKGRNRVMAK